MKAIFQVLEIFPGVLSVFWYSCFLYMQTDIFQRAILYRNKGDLILYLVI